METDCRGLRLVCCRPQGRCSLTIRLERPGNTLFEEKNEGGHTRQMEQDHGEKDLKGDRLNAK